MKKTTGLLTMDGVVVALLLAMTPGVRAESGTWNVDAAGNWSTAGSWLGTIIPGTNDGTIVSTDTATFGKLLAAPRTVTVDASRNIRDIVFDDSNSSASGYTLSGGSLLLTAGGSVQATGSSGAHTDTINSSLTITGNGATGTLANTSSLATRLLSINSVAGQSTVGNTTTLILGGNNNAATNLLNGLTDGAYGGKVGVTKDGSGIWRLVLNGGTTFFSGPITVTGGTVIFPAVNGCRQMFGSAPALIMTNVAGVQLDMGGASYNAVVGLGSLSGGGASGGNIVNAQAANTGTRIGYDNTSTAFGGIISGNTPLTKVGWGTQTLSGANAHGITTIVGGTLRLDFSQAESPAANILPAGGALTLGGAGGGRLELNSSSGADNGQTVNGVTFGLGNNRIALTDNGASSLLLNLKAITRNTGGTLDVTLPAGAQSSSNGVLTTSANFVANKVLVGTVSSGIAFATIGSNTWAGITGGSNIVAFTEAGGSYGTGAANYLSATNVDVLNGDSPASNVTVNTLRFDGNNTLTLTGTNTVGTGGILITPAATTGATISGGTVRAGSGRELVLINNGVQLTVGSIITNSSSGSSALTLAGTGTTVLTGVNTYTGATCINGGTVKAGSSQAFGGGSALIIADNPDAVLDLNGYDLEFNSMAGNINVSLGFGTAGGRVLLGGNSLTVGAGNSSTEFGGRISGTGGLIKTGTGNLTLSGSNSFSGGIRINNGTVTGGGMKNTTPLGTNTIFLGDISGTNNATLVLGDKPSFFQTFPNNIILSPRGTGILTISQTTGNGQAIFSGNVSGSNDVIFSVTAGTQFALNSGLINNVGNVRLTTVANSTFANCSINFGSNVSNIIIDANNTGANNNPGTQFTGNFNNTGYIIFTGSASSVYNPAWINGLIESGVKGVIVNGAVGSAEVRISGTNLFSGDTTIMAGQLTLYNNLALQNSAVNYQAGALAFNFAVTAPVFGGLTGSNDLTLSSTVKTNYLNPGAGITKTYSGSLNGAMVLIKTNSGTQVFSGDNVYTNITTVAGGALRLAGANALPGGIGPSGGSNTLTLAGGVVELGAGDFTRALGAGTANVRFTASGGFSAYGANRIVNLGGATGTVTWGSGSFVPTGSSLILGSAMADSTLDFQNPIALSNAVRTVQVDDGAAGVDAVISGGISGSAGNGLVKTGNGTLSLTGNNTYDGTTTVSNGALLVNGPLGSTNQVVRSGAALGGTGTVSAAVLTLDSNAVLRATILDIYGNSECLNVDGAFNASNVTLQIVNTNLLTVGQSYRVVTCGGHINTFIGANVSENWIIDYRYADRILLRARNLTGFLLKLQ